MQKAEKFLLNKIKLNNRSLEQKKERIFEFTVLSFFLFIFDENQRRENQHLRTRVSAKKDNKCVISQRSIT